uniref:Alpha/beta hydrolase fold-3 domain-containing protein n=1 Tax=Cucumis melo TaxID=3656 RepID=A0A9I9D8I0_CUCME
MPSVAVKLYSVFFKFLLKHRLQNLIQAPLDESSPFGVTSRPEETVASANPLFTDGVATKDIHIDPFTSLSIRIFLPESALTPPESDSKPSSKSSKPKPKRSNQDAQPDLVHHNLNNLQQYPSRRNSYGPSGNSRDELRVSRIGGYSNEMEGLNLIPGPAPGGVYRGYAPVTENSRRLPVMLQFHGGGWVSGSNDSAANDFFCRRIAKLCDVIVVAVGYRLAPENRFPAAFEDGLKVLNWLGKQANLAECSKSMGNTKGSGNEFKKSDNHRHIVDTFGASMVEPWLAAHGDPTRSKERTSELYGLICSKIFSNDMEIKSWKQHRKAVWTWAAMLKLILKIVHFHLLKKFIENKRCVLLGVSCGANVADYVARKAVEAGKLLDPVKVVAQVLLYPFFIGSVPTHSELKLANSYFYDKAMCLLAWKLFLPEEKFSLDHPAANPLVSGREGPPLKLMPPTLTVVAELDWMRDRAIAYSEELRKVNVDAPVLDYKDAVHEFATLDILLKTPQAQACAEDIAIWQLEVQDFQKLVGKKVQDYKFWWPLMRRLMAALEAIALILALVKDNELLPPKTLPFVTSALKQHPDLGLVYLSYYFLHLHLELPSSLVEYFDGAFWTGLCFQHLKTQLVVSSCCPIHHPPLQLLFPLFFLNYY